LEVISLIFISALKINFYVKMKIRDIISNGLTNYPGYDPEQHSRDFSHRSDTLRNTNAGTYSVYNFQAS